MTSWAFGWQYTQEHIDFIASAVAPDPDPSPGYGQVTRVYDYASGHQFLFYMPPYLTFDPYLRDILDAEGEEISVIRATFDRILEQFYLAQTVEWGLQLWEEMVGVAIAPDNVSDEDRRAAVKSRIVIGPRTVAEFVAFIRDFTGVDGAITENFALYTVDVIVYASKTDEEKAAFEEAFERALPAHLGVALYTYGGFVPGLSTAGDTL